MQLQLESITIIPVKKLTHEGIDPLTVMVFTFSNGIYNDHFVFFLMQNIWIELFQ